MPYPGIPANQTAKMERCVKRVMATGKDKSTAIAICNKQITKKEGVTIENLKFEYAPDNFEIQEGSDDKGNWISIGGVALVEGVSKNQNYYSIKNLEENDGREFKYIFGHPMEAEDHVVGLGKLSMENNVLRHDGKIRNTHNHPDVIESVKDKFVGPSIHAAAKKVTFKEGKYHMEGLSIEGVGLVAFQGVKKATIDYAIAESFDKKMLDRTESSEEDANTNNDMEGDNMPDEEKPEEAPKEEETPEAPAEGTDAKPAEEPAPEEPKTESVSLSEFKAVQKELKEMKEQKKKELVESIVAMNKNLKTEDLMKESENELMLRKQYEQKMCTTENLGVVDMPKNEGDGISVVESGDEVTVAQESWNAFNEELRKRVR